MNELALFAGAGGGILGGKILGWRTVCAVERDAFAATVLVQRQNDGLLPPFPVWSDIETFDGKPWRGIVEVVSGGFPCQDISAAGRGAGIDGERSGLWVEMARVIREVRPRFAFVENSPMLTSRGLGTVLGDLAAMGFDARWGVLGAADAGAPHLRERIWIVAHASQYGRRPWRSGRSDPGGEGEPELALQTVANAGSGRFSGPRGGEGEQPRGAETIGASEDAANAEQPGLEGFRSDAGQPEKPEPWSGCALADTARIQQGRQEQWPKRERTRQGGEQDVSDASQYERDRRPEGVGRWLTRSPAACGGPRRGSDEGTDWWLSEPAVGRVANGVADRVDRLKALGNGQVPAVAALAWRRLTR